MPMAPRPFGLDKNGLIESVARKYLGEPLIRSQLKDLQEAKERACFRFYIAQPILRQYMEPVSRGTKGLDIPTVMTTIFENDKTEASRYYFIGLVHHDFARTGEDMPVGLPFGNLYTLVPQHPLTMRGTMRGYGPFYGGLSLFKPLDVLPLKLRATETDILDSDPYFNIDEVNNKLWITTPDTGTLTMIWALGYAGDRQVTPQLSPWDRIPVSQVELVGKLTAEEALEAIVSSRSQISVDGADYNIDISHLKDLLNELKEQNKADLKTAFHFPIHAQG